MNNHKYNVNQKIAVFSDNKIEEYTLAHKPFFQHDHYVYLVECEDFILSIDEEEIYTIEDLEKLHNELENLILMEKSDALEKMLKDCNFYSKLFQIENFLCDND